MLSIYKTSVVPEWIDYNDHMTEGFYGVVFANASDEFLIHIGFDEAYRQTIGGSFYTAETHIVFRRELKLGAPLRVDTQVLGIDHKRVHLFHFLYDDDQGYLAATQETMMLHVDMVSGRVTSMEQGVLERGAEIGRTHATLPIPKDTNRTFKRVVT